MVGGHPKIPRSTRHQPPRCKACSLQPKCFLRWQFLEQRLNFVFYSIHYGLQRFVCALPDDCRCIVPGIPTSASVSFDNRQYDSTARRTNQLCGRFCHQGGHKQIRAWAGISLDGQHSGLYDHHTTEWRVVNDANNERAGISVTPEAQILTNRRRIERFAGHRIAYQGDKPGSQTPRCAKQGRFPRVQDKR
jgi:hypothetical protein